MSAQPHPAPATVPATAPAVSEDDIAAFVVERFLPGVDAAELDAEYDLLATAVIDSLGVLRIAEWLADRHRIVVPDTELTTRNFRSVGTILATAERAAAGEGHI
ncbi:MULTISPECIES: acyl carrier protein [unclassified Streptomyces]|uniref:acyl carrier protein n=1 Tax=unclassified Streptomyces TaxID=2593676 RepID=UPI003369C1DC